MKSSSRQLRSRSASGSSSQRGLSIDQIWLDDLPYQPNYSDWDLSHAFTEWAEPDDTQPDNAINDENSNNLLGSTEVDDLYCEEEFPSDSLSCKNFTDDDKLGIATTLHRLQGGYSQPSPPVIMSHLAIQGHIHKPVAVKPDPSAINIATGPQVIGKSKRPQTYRQQYLYRLHKLNTLSNSAAGVDSSSVENQPPRRRKPRLCETYRVKEKDPGPNQQRAKSRSRRSNYKPTRKPVVGAAERDCGGIIGTDMSPADGSVIQSWTVETADTVASEPVVAEAVTSEIVVAGEPVVCDQLLLEFPFLYYKLACSDDSSEKELESRRSRAGVAYRILDSGDVVVDSPQADVNSPQTDTTSLQTDEPIGQGEITVIYQFKIISSKL